MTTQTAVAPPGQGSASEPLHATAVRLDLDSAAVLNFAMEQNGVPVIREIAVSNEGSTPLRDATIELEIRPELMEPLILPIPELERDQTYRLGLPELRLAPGKLGAITEAERAEIRCRVTASGATLAEATRPLRVLAFNEWPGADAPPGLLASFVLPNHPVIGALLRDVRERLLEAGVADGIDGYQSKKRERARDLVKALYDAFQSLGIGYVGAPPSFERSGQKIRFPDAVLGDRLGCCLDLAVLFAAALEQMGLAPILVLLRGHAIVAAWLGDERFAAGVVEDAARLRTQVQLANVVPIEITACTSSIAVPFETAVAQGLEKLRDDEAFECAVDVRAVRAEYRPLPIHTVAAEAGQIDGTPEAAPGVAARILALAAADAARSDSSSSAAPATAPVPETDIDRRFRRWKEKLLDITNRNRLISFRSDARTALQLAVPDLELLEDGIFSNRTFEILPRPDTGPDDPRDPALAERRTHEEARAHRLQDLKRFRIHCRHASEDLWTRAHKIEREARTAIEEGGATILYLAIGFLSWFEDATAEQPRLAPLLLYPVELQFDARARRVRLRRLPDDPVLNVTLVEKLRRDHEVDVSALDAVPMNAGDDVGVDVRGLLRRFREAIQHIPRWEVLEEAHLGTFYFSKFLMWKDLDENSERFLQNPVVRRIASRDVVRLQQKPPVLPEEVDAIHPADLPTILNADSSQLAAVASALDGQSFVLQGPPGTGKSQTIANLIAAALARQRTVLFVSEKMAALEVVQRRLRDAGLDDFCLELHSHKANKKQAVESLRRALEHTARTDERAWEVRGDALVQARKQLDDYVDALHRKGAIGWSVYEARGRLAELAKVADERLDPGVVAGLDDKRLDSLRRMVEEFAAVAEGVDPVAEHPFREACRRDWAVGAEEQLVDALVRARANAEEWQAARATLAAVIGVGQVSSAVAEDLAVVARAAALEAPPAHAAREDWPACSERARGCVKARRAAEVQANDLGARWSPSFLDLPSEALIRRFERWATAFFVFAWIMLFTARRQLRRHARGALPRNSAILGDLEASADLRARGPGLEAESVWTAGLLGTTAGAPPDRWETLLAALDAAHPALRRVCARGGPSADALAAIDTATPERRRALVTAGDAAADAAVALRRSESLVASLLSLPEGTLPDWTTPEHPATTVAMSDRWSSGMRQFRGWCLYRAAAEALGNAGAGELARAHAGGLVAARELTGILEKAVLRQWHSAAVDASPPLRDFEARQHSLRVEQFRELDRAHIDASRRHVIATLEGRLPSLAASQVASSEPAIVMREAQKRSRHLPIRRLFQEIPTILPRLKPCFLMSPLSVAQYLPADAPPFDLVVFDEASQICTHDAIGAIARGRQVIIVGDSRQLPPTSFFTRSGADDDLPDEDDSVESELELESVLDEAVAKLVPQQRLGWHYRSRHEALIDFSNRHIYEGRLDVFPAAQFQSDDVGVHWRKVPGAVYQGGKGPGGRTNQREAEVLVQELVSQLKRHHPADRTFGIVTFNMPQQQLILDLIDEARIDPEVDRHFAGTEPLFVKNLENVQGDERDEILFSICNAPDAKGRFSVQTGALNGPGGDRRLNVAITRARKKLVVYSSIEPEQIDRSRTKARGIWLLRDFLQYVRDRANGVRAPADGHEPSEQERTMAEALRAAGWEVDTGIGCSGYRLDLAIRHPSVPGRYGVAVESDGHAYRSARSTRDRDRLRGEVLASLGWRLEREWSSSWWFDGEAAARSLVENVRGAMERPIEAADTRARPAEPAPRPAEPAPRPTEAATRDGEAPEGMDTPASSTPPPPPPPAAERTVPPHQNDPVAARGTPDDLHDPTCSARVRDQIVEVVLTEGPIHQELVARRLAGRFGIQRLTARVAQRITDLVDQLQSERQVLRRSEFVWPGDLDPESYRDFRGAAVDDQPTRDLDMIAPEEIANAASALLEDAGSLDRAALAREVARLFGIQRLGISVRECVERGLELLVMSGRAAVRGDRIHAGNPAEEHPRKA
jgi:hypothetical protein